MWPTNGKTKAFWALCLAAVAAVVLCGVPTAAKKKIDGIGMSGSALLLPYQLGVAKTFIEYGMVEKYPTAGTSGGALSAILACSGMDFEVFKTFMFLGIEYCSIYSCAGNLGVVLNAALDLLLPKNAHVKCTNKVIIHVTVATVPDNPSAPVCYCTQTDKNMGIDVKKYSSLEDLKEALRSTTYLARICGPTCTRPFRDYPEVCDGGYSDNLPCPAEALKAGKFCLKSSVYPSFLWDSKTNTSGPADIYPGVRGDDTLPIKDRSLWNGITYNATTVFKYINEIYDAGRLDSKFWLRTHGFKPLQKKK